MKKNRTLPKWGYGLTLIVLLVVLYKVLPVLVSFTFNLFSLFIYLAVMIVAGIVIYRFIRSMVS